MSNYRLPFYVDDFQMNPGSEWEFTLDLTRAHNPPKVSSPLYIVGKDIMTHDNVDVGDSINATRIPNGTVLQPITLLRITGVEDGWSESIGIRVVRTDYEKSYVKSVVLRLRNYGSALVKWKQREFFLVASGLDGARLPPNAPTTARRFSVSETPAVVRDPYGTSISHTWVQTLEGSSVSSESSSSISSNSSGPSPIPDPGLPAGLYQDTHRIPVRLVSNSTTLSKDDRALICDTRQRSFAVQLPTAEEGMHFNIKKNDTSDNKVTVLPASGSTIDGGNQYLMVIPMMSISVVCFQGKWLIF